MKKISLTLLCCFLAISSLWSQLTFIVSGLPPNTSDKLELFIAGTFNNWNPGEQGYQLSKNEDGFYSLTINPSKGNHKFKFTRGSWATVEGDQSGNYRPDRIFNYNGKKQNVYCNILAWEGNSGNKKSTASPNVLILDPSFDMPQLNSQRRIWVYLPPDYYQSQKSYPVIYLHDGQNLFDQSTSYSGEWKIDESLDDLSKNTGLGFIAVGIDNGGSDRLSEYSPTPNSKYGGGRGDQYVQFLLKNLKPFIDKTFRTLSDRENTLIMGSSMGGLISMYAVIEYPEIFGKAGVFSPSFWYTEGHSYWHVLNKGRKDRVKIYMMAGGKEGRNMANDMLAMKRTLQVSGFPDREVFHKVHADGEHKEWFWSREFLPALYWLFRDDQRQFAQKTLSSSTIDPIGISPISEREFELTYQTPVAKPKISIANSEGLIILKPKKIKLSNQANEGGLQKGIFKFKPPKEGSYFIQFFDEDQLLLVQKMR